MQAPAVQSYDVCVDLLDRRLRKYEKRGRRTLRESPDDQRLTRKPTLTGCSNRDGAGTLHGGGAGSWPFRGRVVPGGENRRGDAER